jgi:hypothetical protein
MITNYYVLFFLVLLVVLVIVFFLDVIDSLECIECVFNVLVLRSRYSNVFASSKTTYELYFSDVSISFFKFSSNLAQLYIADFR